MVTASGLTLVDTNVFVIDLRYRRDRNFRANRRLLDRIARDGDGATTLFNLLEVCGILSFNLNALQLRELFFHLPARYGIRIVPAGGAEHALPELTAGEVLEARRRASEMPCSRRRSTNTFQGRLGSSRGTPIISAASSPSPCSLPANFSAAAGGSPPQCGTATVAWCGASSGRVAQAVGFASCFLGGVLGRLV